MQTRLEVEVIERANGRFLRSQSVAGQRRFMNACSAACLSSCPLGYSCVSGLCTAPGGVSPLWCAGGGVAVGVGQATLDRSLCLVPGTLGATFIVA